MTGRLRLRGLLRRFAARPGVGAIVLGLLTLGWGALLTLQGRPLGALDSRGILAFELAPAGPATLPTAPDCSAARSALANAEEPTLADLLAAAETCGLTSTLVAQLRLDFPFIPLYVGFAIALVVWLLRRLRGAPAGSSLRFLVRPNQLALVLAVTAGALDVLENLALLGQIGGPPGAEVAWSPLYARSKFTLLLVVALGVAVSWVAVRAGSHRPAEESG